MTGPHDRFFRYTFAHPERAAALLRYNLPAPLISMVDWSSLRRESGTLVDWGRETRKDLLFSARYHGSAEHEPRHFFPIEHQSRVERWMSLRMLDYSGRLIQNWHEVHPHSLWLPAVTPLVVYPRQGRGWSAPLRLEEYYRVPGGVVGAGLHSPWSLAIMRVLHSIMEPERTEGFMRTMAEVLRDQGREEGLAKGLAEGEAKGLAKAVLQLLAARRIRVDKASRQRIQSCLDVVMLERWLERALSATRLSEVLDGPAQ